MGHNAKRFGQVNILAVYNATPREIGILLVITKRRMDIKRVSTFQPRRGVIAGAHGDFPGESWKSFSSVTSIYVVHLKVICFKKHSTSIL